eukprot:2297400-Prymnesium_polylepis.2
MRSEEAGMGQAASRSPVLRHRAAGRRVRPRADKMSHPQFVRTLYTLSRFIPSLIIATTPSVCPRIIRMLVYHVTLLARVFVPSVQCMLCCVCGVWSSRVLSVSVYDVYSHLTWALGTLNDIPPS